MPKIGTKLKKLRNRRRLSIRALALRTGVAHSTISLIERDRISPSIDTLGAIVDSLGTTLTTFFSKSDVELMPQPFYSAEDLLEIGTTDKISHQMIGSNFPERQMLVLKETYSPGAVSEVNLTHKAEEAGIVLTGKVKVSVGEQSKILKPGEAYYFDSQIPHTFENLSNDESVIFSAITPPSY